MTIHDILQSLVIGISIGSIPGPIFFELIRRTLARGFLSGALLAVGEFLGNFLFLLLIFFGVSYFFTQDIVRSILFLSGAAVLIYLAIGAFKLKETDIEISYEQTNDNRN